MASAQAKRVFGKLGTQPEVIEWLARTPPARRFLEQEEREETDYRHRRKDHHEVGGRDDNGKTDDELISELARKASPSPPRQRRKGSNARSSNYQRGVVALTALPGFERYGMSLASLVAAPGLKVMQLREALKAAALGTISRGGRLRVDLSMCPLVSRSALIAREAAWRYEAAGDLVAYGALDRLELDRAEFAATTHLLLQWLLGVYGSAHATFETADALRSASTGRLIQGTVRTVGRRQLQLPISDN